MNAAARPVTTYSFQTDASCISIFAHCQTRGFCPTSPGSGLSCSGPCPSGQHHCWPGARLVGSGGIRLRNVPPVTRTLMVGLAGVTSVRVVGVPGGQLALAAALSEDAWFELRLAQWGIDRAAFRIPGWRRRRWRPAWTRESHSQRPARSDSNVRARRGGGRIRAGISCPRDVRRGNHERLIALVRPLIQEALERVTECRSGPGPEPVGQDRWSRRDRCVAASGARGAVVMPAIIPRLRAGDKHPEHGKSD